MMTLTRASVLPLARPLRRGLCDAHNIELRRGWRRATAGAVCRISDDEHINLKRERHPALSGAPLSPLLDESLVLVRYMYEGGVLSQGRLCKITPNSAQAVTGTELLATPLRTVSIWSGSRRACTRQPRPRVRGYQSARTR